MIDKSYPYLVSLVSPAVLPISDGDLHNWVRLINAAPSETATLQGLLKAAISWFEDNTNYQVRPANYEWYTNEIPETLPKKPYKSGLTIAIRNEAGTYDTIDSADYRVVKTSPDTVKIVFNVQKPTIADEVDSVKINFVAGWESIPENVLNAFKIRVGSQFDDRGDSPDELNRLSETLIQTYLPPQLA